MQNLRKLNGPGIVVAMHSIAIIVAAAMYFTGALSSPPPYDDVYFPYLFISGPVVWGVSLWLSGLCDSFLLTHLPYRAGSDIAIAILPGVLNLVLGGLQWYVIAVAIRALWRRHQSQMANRGFTPIVPQDHRNAD